MVRHSRRNRRGKGNGNKTKKVTWYLGDPGEELKIRKCKKGEDKNCDEKKPKVLTPYPHDTSSCTGADCVIMGGKKRKKGTKKKKKKKGTKKRRRKRN